VNDEHEQRIQERQREREERRREREEWRQERRKWRRNDPIGPIVGALVLIWLGVVLLAAQNPEMFRLPFAITWNNAWSFFFAGLGGILILEALLRAVVPTYRHGLTGRLIGGTILLLLGLAGILPGISWNAVWPLALIALGAGLLLTNLLRR
jgi:hypothetical protein